MKNKVATFRKRSASVVMLILDSWSLPFSLITSLELEETDSERRHLAFSMSFFFFFFFFFHLLYVTGMPTFFPFALLATNLGTVRNSFARKQASHFPLL